MVERLLTFIYAKFNRNWIIHLKSGKDLCKDLCLMEQIKFLRLWIVYLANTISLEQEEPLIWEEFMGGSFWVQKKEPLPTMQ